MALTPEEEIELLELEIEIEEAERANQTSKPREETHEEWKANPERKFTPDVSMASAVGRGFRGASSGLNELGAKLGVEAFERGDMQEPTQLWEATYTLPSAPGRRISEPLNARQRTELEKQGAVFEKLSPTQQMQQFEQAAVGSERQDLEQAYDAQPGAFITGQALGTAAKAVPLARASTAANALAGAAEGVAGGETMPEKLAYGAVGAALPYLTKGVISGKDPQAALNKRNVETMLDIPAPERKRIVREFGEKGLYDVGQTLRERGLTNVPRSENQLVDAIKAIKQETGQQIGERIAGISEDAFSVSKQNLLDTLEQTVKSRGDTGAGSAALNQLKSILDNPLNAFPEDLSPGDVQKLQGVLSRSVKSFDPATQSEAAKLISDVASAGRQSLRNADPDLAPLQKAYGILSSAKKGADQAVQSDFAKLKATTSWNKALQNTLYAPQGQGGINLVLEFATQFQEGKLGAAFQQAAQRGPDAVRALHYIQMQRDPSYNQAYMKREQGSDE